MVSFNYVCSGLLAKRDLKLFPLDLKLCRSLWSIDVVLVGICAYLLWEEPTVMIPRHTCPRKAVPTEHKGVELGISSLRR